MALDVGGIVANLGARLDPDAFDRFDRRLDSARRAARDDVEAKLRGDHDDRGFDQFGRRLDTARRDARDDVEAKLRGDHDDSAFDRFKRRLDATRRDARDSVEAKLRGDHDPTGFDRFDRRLADARREASTPATAELGARVDPSGFREYEQAGRGVELANSRMTASSRGVGLALGASLGGVGVAAAGVAGLAFGTYKAVEAFEEAEVVARRQALVIRTMGQDAGASAEHINQLAESMARKTGIDDDAIISGANIIRTFKNIRNEAGPGADIFDRTTKAAVDLSAAFGTDLQSASIQLGKALDDPARGAAALSRTGAIAKADVEALKKAAEDGVPKLELQRRVLDAVERQVEGTAESSATAAGKMRNAFDELGEAIGEHVAPAFNRAAGAITRFVNGMRTGEGAGGRFADRARGVARTVGGAFTAIGDTARSVFRFVGRIIDENRDTLSSMGRTISGLWSTARRAFAGIRAALESTFGGRSGTGRDIRQIIRALLDIADAGLKVLRAIAQRALPGIIQAFQGFARIVRGVIRVISGVLTGDFGKAWDGVKDIFSGGAKALGGILRGITAPVRELADVVTHHVVGVIGGVWRTARTQMARFADAWLGGLTTIMGGISSFVDAASRIPGVGARFRGVARFIDDARDRIDDYRASLRGMTGDHERAADPIARLRSRVDTLRERLGTLRKGSSEYRDTAARLRKTQDELNDAMGAAHAAGRKGARGPRAVGGAARSAASATSRAGAIIAGTYNQLAAQFGGLKPVTFTAARSLGSPISDSFEERRHGGFIGRRFAHGGRWIGGRGPQGPDDQLVLAGRGEAFLNVPQQGPVEEGLALRAAILGGGPASLDELFSAAMFRAGGRVTTGVRDLIDGVAARFATGGRLPDVDGAKPGFAVFLRHFQRAFSPQLFVSSGKREAGGLVAGTNRVSNHGSGNAIDISHPAAVGATEQNPSPPNPLDKVFPFIRRYLPVLDLLWRTQQGGNHEDHVHWGSPDSAVGSIAAARKLAARLPGGLGEVRVPRIGGPDGALKRMVKRTATLLTRGANRRIDAALDAAADAAGAGARGRYTGPPSGPGVVRGRVSVFGPPLEGAGTTASGASSAEAGLALNINPGTDSGWNNPTTDRWVRNRTRFRVRIAGKTATLPVIDKGPAGFTGRAIDVTGAGSRVLGINPRRFPTDAIGSAEQIGSAHRHGGFVGLQRFRHGGHVKSPSSIVAPLRKTQGIRINRYTRAEHALGRLQADYAYMDRSFNLTDEELIDEETGEVNGPAVARRVRELRKLVAQRERILEKLAEMRRIIELIQTTYRTMIERLTRAMKAISRKTKSGRERIGRYEDAIKKYTGELRDWKDKEDSTRDAWRDADLDVKETKAEAWAVAGTRARPVAADTPDTPPDDTPPDDTPPSDTPPSDTPPAPAPAPPDPAEVAAQALAQLGAFQAARADLFGSYGANYQQGGAFRDVGAQAAGTRFYGGSRSGSDPGVIAGAGGAGPQINQHITFTGPAPADPHTFTQAALHELRAAL